VKHAVNTVEIFLPLAEAGSAFSGGVGGSAGLQEDWLRQRVAAAFGVRVEDLAAVGVVKRSLDARKGRPIGWRLVVEAHVGGAGVAGGAARATRRAPVDALRGRRVVVVGSGPAGTFAALRLAEAGAAVAVVELGKAVQPRRHDLARLVRRGELDQASNYCFGEGGAGTFSDGKLYTRTKDREAVAEVLDILVAHGADPDIRIDSRPHVGSNKLPLILVALRRHLESMGVTYRWSDPLVGIRSGSGSGSGGRVRGAVLASGEELACEHLILAVGHSARDTYARLIAAGVAAEAKPFAIGVRVEHPQPLVDRIQYGEAHGHPLLPAAFYHVTATVDAAGEERGVYSFCMCPGGWIVNSSTEPERLATNGMSLKRRDSPYANSALIVTVAPGDLAAYGDPTAPMTGVAFQRAVEERVYRLGGGGFVAPAQRLPDFLARRASAIALRSSYRPGVIGADLAEALPPFVGDALRRAIPVFERTMRGFNTGEAQLVGVETRTSSPLRFLRDARTLDSPSHPGLHPCGEGAGYAGGIVSAAIDGLRVAEAILISAGVTLSR
jgi:uncharacterized protein